MLAKLWKASISNTLCIKTLKENINMLESLDEKTILTMLIILYFLWQKIKKEISVFKRVWGNLADYQKQKCESHITQGFYFKGIVSRISLDNGLNVHSEMFTVEFFEVVNNWDSFKTSKGH